jgi:hypothetical protein
VQVVGLQVALGHQSSKKARSSTSRFYLFLLYAKAALPVAIAESRAD